MSSTLYKEALLEVDELKRMAEENAKNKIIEAVTPQIRRMIESQLLGEKKVDELDDLDDLAIDSDADETVELDMSAPLPPAPAAPEPKQAAPKIQIDVQGDLNIEMEEEEDDEDLILGRNVSDVVESYIMGKRSPRYRVDELSRKTKTLSKMLKTINLAEATTAQRKIAVLYYAKLLDEAVSLASSGIVIEESVDLGLLSQLKTTIKEIRQMANRRDAVAFRRLLEELEADEGLKEIMKEEEEESAAEEAADVDADVSAASDAAEDIKAAADDLMAALGLDDADDDDEDDDDEEEVEVEAGEEVLELGEADDKDEASHMEASHKDEADDMDEVYEIDEAMLRRELLRMREGLEAEAGDPSADESEIGNPLDAQEDFGGSEEVIEVSEEDLVEALHLELNRMRRPSRRPARRRRVAESRRRSPRRRRKVVTETKQNAKLRKQLHEMNVFNAKLLFANKLMQNRELTKKQQRAIVEALDSAKTVNEAKLLYKSLSASLKQQGGTLSESKNRLLASSSRSTRSASPASNGVDGDRWALLAGLSAKK